MFRAKLSPIIRSTWLYLQYLVVFTQVAAGWFPIRGRRVRFIHPITKARKHTHRLIILNIYCFSTAQTVTRTRRNVTLYYAACRVLIFKVPRMTGAHPHPTRNRVLFPRDKATGTWPFKTRIKSHLLFAGIIRSSPFSPR